MSILIFQISFAQTLDEKIKERKINEIRSIIDNVRLNNNELLNKKVIFYMAYKPYEENILDSNYFSYIGVIGNNYNLVEYIVISNKENSFNILPMPDLEKCFGYDTSKELMDEKDKFEKILLSTNKDCKSSCLLDIRDSDLSHSNLTIQYLAIYDVNNILVYEGSFNAGLYPHNIEARILDYPLQLFLMKFKNKNKCYPLIK